MKLGTIVSAARKVGYNLTVEQGKWVLRDTKTSIRLTHLSDVRLIVLAEITNRLQAYPT